MTNNKNFNINNLSKKEINLILESLLFASSVDVCASWYKEHNLEFLEIAKKIRKNFPDVIVENIYVYDDEKISLNDEHAKDIIEYFPELKTDLKELEGLDFNLINN